MEFSSSDCVSKSECAARRDECALKVAAIALTYDPNAKNSVDIVNECEHYGSERGLQPWASYVEYRRRHSEDLGKALEYPEFRIVFLDMVNRFESAYAMLLGLREDDADFQDGSLHKHARLVVDAANTEKLLVAQKKDLFHINDGCLSTLKQCLHDVKTRIVSTVFGYNGNSRICESGGVFPLPKRKPDGIVYKTVAPFVGDYGEIKYSDERTVDTVMVGPAFAVDIDVYMRSKITEEIVDESSGVNQYILALRKKQFSNLSSRSNLVGLATGKNAK